MSEIFVFFFEPEFLFTEPYSSDLYNGSGYTLLGLTMLLTSVITMAVFYYLWNPIFGRWYHWMLTMIIAAAIAFGASYGILNEELVMYLDDPEYPDVEFFIFKLSAMTAFYTFIFSFIFSFVIRLGSSNNKANPFPLKFT